MNAVIHNPEYSIYPGKYVPILNEEEIVQIQKEHAATPSVNIIDSNAFYKIEIALPGVERRNFVVYADNNVLSVYVIQQKTDNPGQFRLLEFRAGFALRLHDGTLYIDERPGNACRNAGHFQIRLGHRKGQRQL